MDTNLYDFLRHIHRQAQGPHGDAVISEEHWEWLDTYLRHPGTVIEFRARPTGRLIGMLPEAQAELSDKVAPITVDFNQHAEVEKHFALAGDANEVFALLFEAMALNPTFAHVVISAGRAYAASAPICRRCSQRHHGRREEDCPNIADPKWEFKPRPL